MKVIATLYVLFLFNFCIYAMWQMNRIWVHGGGMDALIEVFTYVLAFIAVLSVGVLVALLLGSS